MSAKVPTVVRKVCLDRKVIYRRSHDHVYHCDVVEQVTTNTAERKVRSLKYDRIPTSDKQDDDGSCVRAIEKDGAAGYVSIERDGWPQVE